MAETLRDQLLKSGLVQKLKQDQPSPEHAKGGRARDRAVPRTPAIARPARETREIDLARAYALRERNDRAERERARQESERLAREKKERRQKLATVLAGKTCNDAQADIARHFPHGAKIRRVYCTPGQLTRLNAGELAVVQLQGRYLLVEREIALAAREIDPEALALLVEPGAGADEDVPADLVW